MRTLKKRYDWFATSAIGGLEAGALLFVSGLLALYLNPFWHFNESGMLDWRVHWWNAAGEILLASGLVIEALAAIWSAAVLLSRSRNRGSWPYFAAGVLVFAVLVWAGAEGFVRNFSAHFEWNAAEGFSVFRLSAPGHAASDPAAPQNSLWQSIVELQIQPLLRGYFRLNDWQRMNGDVAVNVVRVIPVAWPLELESGSESVAVEDPDQTPLMQAAQRQDLNSLQQSLSRATPSEVNALDQGGQTALILACRNPKASPDVVKALLAAGADVNVRARNGYAPLTWALARNNQEVVRILRRAGAKP